MRRRPSLRRRMDLAIQGLGWAGTRSIVCLRLRPKTGVGETARELVHASSGLIMGIEGGDSHFVHHEVVNIEVKDDIYIGSVNRKPWVPFWAPPRKTLGRRDRRL